MHRESLSSALPLFTTTPAPSSQPEPKPSKRSYGDNTTDNHASNPRERLRGLRFLRRGSVRDACRRRARSAGSFRARRHAGFGLGWGGCLARRAIGWWSCHARRATRRRHGQGQTPVDGAGAPGIPAALHDPAVGRRRVAAVHGHGVAGPPGLAVPCAPQTVGRRAARTGRREVAVAADAAASCKGAGVGEDGAGAAAERFDCWMSGHESVKWK